MSVSSAVLADIAAINPTAPKGIASDTELASLPMAAVSSELADVVPVETLLFEDVKNGLTYFEDGDILVAKITPCFENGKIALVRSNGLAGFGSTEFHVVRVSERIDRRYLIHFLRQQSIRNAGEKRMTGSAGQKRVPKSFLEQLEIPLPPLEEQQRIAAILDAADALRAKRRAALAKLDTLAQSIFIDMFGDPATNPRNWKRVRLGDTSLKFSDGPFGSNLKSAHYTENGIRVVRLQNIGVDRFVDDDVAYISEEHFGKISKHECVPGDVLVGTLGDPNLRACIQPNWLPLALNKADCVQIRVNPNVATAEFMVALLNCPSTLKMAQSEILGQTRSRISMGRLRELVVPIPPVNLQSEFSERRMALDLVQTRVEISVRQLDALFASLQHRAFRGELTAPDEKVAAA